MALEPYLKRDKHERCGGKCCEERRRFFRSARFHSFLQGRIEQVVAGHGCRCRGAAKRRLDRRSLGPFVMGAHAARVNGPEHVSQKHAAGSNRWGKSVREMVMR